MKNEIACETLLGKTITKINGDAGSNELLFTFDNGDTVVMYHAQDCCELVIIEDIVGDLKDLIGSPLIQAEESSNSNPRPGQEIKPYDDSFTWTFYKFGTANGRVTIRWYGTSNGYYSESVTLLLNNPTKEC